MTRNLEELAERNRVARQKAGVEDEMLDRPGVNAIDVDYKTVGGERTETLAIVIWVDEKKDVPEAERLPSAVKGVPTDVVEGRVVPKLGPERSTVAEATPAAAKLVGGLSIGPCAREVSGTLGIVRKVGDVNMILSNFHVLSDGAMSEPEAPIVQPGLNNGGICPDQVAGKYEIGFLGQPSNVDAAIARVVNRSSCPDEIKDVGTVTDFCVAFMGDQVGSYGAVGGGRSGFVTTTTFSFEFVDPVFGEVRFHNQIRVTNGGVYLEAGDSGSILFDQQFRAVGLLHTGFEFEVGGVTIEDGIANPIHDVKLALGL